MDRSIRNANIRKTINAAGITLGLATLAAASMPARAVHAETGKAAPEFGGEDATALAERKHVETDCKIDWVAKTGKRYCFASEDSKAAFLKSPDEMVDKATDMAAAGNVENIGRAMEDFNADQAADYVKGFIESAAKANGGTYVFNDPVTNTSIPLAFDSIDFTRTLKGYGFFPDVRFHAKDDKDKKYLIDFWVVPKGGKLTVLEQRVYKAPYKNGSLWTMMQRQPKPWWWIPAAEHPGETEQKRSWEVMSSIDKFVQEQAGKNKGVFSLKDDKTGEMIPLKFLYVHQPVRRLKSNGVYFACTDFRKEGSKDEIYDIDFWLNDKTGAVTVNQVKVHKVPELKDGSMVQVPRYNFDPKTYDQVP